MKAQPTIARRIGIGLLAISATVLTSCAAGKYAGTANQTPAVDGLAKVNVGNMQLRGVAVLTPPDGPSYVEGSNARVTLQIVNVGASADTLTSVTSPVASGYTITSIDAVTGSGSASSSASSSESASTSSSASASSPSSSGASGSSVPAGASSIAIPPGQSVGFDTPDSDKVLVLTGLKAKVYPGTSIQMTFTFAKAGALTVTVPVQLNPDAPASTIPALSGAEG